MIRLFKLKNSFYKIIYQNICKMLHEKQIDSERKMEGLWVTFLYVVQKSCFYSFVGKIIKVKKGTSPLNKTITVNTRISKEKITIILPSEYQYTLIKY